MINVGGSSYNDGIKFVGDNYSVNFITKNGETEIFLRESKNTKKRIKFKLPFFRGIVSLMDTHHIIRAVLLLSVIIDLSESIVLTSKEGTAQIIGQTVMAISSYVLLGVVIIQAIYVVFKLARNINTTWRYHGAEHKVIYVNDEEQEITLENCRKAPRISNRCGTMLLSIFLVVHILLNVILTIFPIDLSSTLQFLIIWTISYELFRVGDNNIIVKQILKIGYLLQKYVFTKEPTDEQLLNAIEAFKVLERAEKGEIPEEELNELLENGKKLNILNKMF